MVVKYRYELLHDLKRFSVSKSGLVRSPSICEGRGSGALQRPTRSASGPARAQAELCRPVYRSQVTLYEVWRHSFAQPKCTKGAMYHNKQRIATTPPHQTDSPTPRAGLVSLTPRCTRYSRRRNVSPKNPVPTRQPQHPSPILLSYSFTPPACGLKKEQGCRHARRLSPPPLSSGSHDRTQLLIPPVPVPYPLPPLQSMRSPQALPWALPESHQVGASRAGGVTAAASKLSVSKWRGPG